MNAAPPSDPLAQLRDLHLPPAASWWPPAPGWWMAALLVLLAGYAAWRFLTRKKTTRAALPLADYQRAALAELTSLEEAWKASGDSIDLLKKCSRLLRRYALARFPKEEAAGLVGSDWLSFLDKTGGDGGFADGPGALLVSGPYGGGVTDADPAPLLTLVKKWIEANP